MNITSQGGATEGNATDDALMVYQGRIPLLTLNKGFVKKITFFLHPCNGKGNCELLDKNPTLFPDLNLLRVERIIPVFR